MNRPNVEETWIGQLMCHMKVLCKDIGPRPPTSAQERQSAVYVKKTLEHLGYRNIEEQTFRSQNSYGWVVTPLLLVASFAVPIAWAGGQWGRFLGGLLLLGSAYTLREQMLAKWPFFQRWIARWSSQNIITTVPPIESPERKVYLIGHLDTQKQRLLAPPPDPGLFPATVTIMILTLALSGILLFLGIPFHWQSIAWWEWGVGILIWLSLLSFLTEERQPHVEGANDNATAVAVLLTIAEILRTQPLRSTEVTLLFTGCEEVMCVGMESYLRQYKPPRENTYWIDLEMVGTGNLCYVTKHGVSYLTQYRPAQEMVQLAAQTAQKHPELAVVGKEMIIVEEVANLRNKGYNAICLAGYDAKGYLPNWHRLSDTLENIEPQTLNRANCFTLALLHEIDSLVN